MTQEMHTNRSLHEVIYFLMICYNASIVESSIKDRYESTDFKTVMAAK